MAGEQFRKEPQHDFAVLQHVGDAGGRARIVFQHIEGFGVDPNDIDAADMDVDVVRHLLAVHFRPEHRILEHQIFRHHAGFENFAPGVDVADVMVDGFDALLEPGAQDVPFGRGENARQHVEGDEPLLRVRFAIDREGDADAAEQDLGLASAVAEHVGRHLGEPAKQLAVGGSQCPVAALHLVERDHHGYPSRARITHTKSRNPILAASCAPTQGVFGPRARAAIAYLCPGFGRRLINAPAWLCPSFSPGVYGVRSFLTRSTTGRGVA